VTIKDRTAIVGIGQTAYAKGLEGSELSLACQAIKAALDDAGLAPADVDGMGSYAMEANIEADVARNLGTGDITWFSQVGFGGGAGCGVVGNAAMAVASGQCQVAVTWRARKRAARGSRPWAQTAERVKGLGEWSRPWGLVRPVDEIAMLTRRYPAAQMYEKKMTREDYMNARWISEPLCLFDNCLETDGAVACVITSAERARDLKQPAALIHSFGQGINAQHQVMTNYHRDDPLMGPAWACAEVLWRNADVTPDDVDVAQIYDAFSPLIPLSLEGYGFCKRGEGGDFTNDGALEWPDGRLPNNTSGGGMSEAYVHGFNLIVEAVRQIRGTSTSQVENVDVSFVTSGEGVPTSALLLTKP
jgi:acetyl-CoA acetyltransferase